jgi:hypothetical protein
MLVGCLSEKISAKTIGWMHSSFEAHFTRAEFFKNLKELFNVKVKNIDKLVVLNGDMQKKYGKDFGVSPIIIHNPRSFTSEKKSNISNPMFVACGRFVEAKGYDLLVEAFRVFSLSNRDWRLTIIGDGFLKPKIERLITKYNLNDRIILTGTIRNVQDVMLDASIFLMTSRWEGFPMAVTEALELGLPVIAFNISAMEPLVENGKEGLLAPSFDTNAYAELMLRLANNADERKRMSVNAIAKANTLSIEKIATQWIDLIEDVTR